MNSTPTMRSLLRKLSENESLSRAEASHAMLLMLGNKCSPEETAALLMGLRSKRETLEELVGLTEAMREQCIPVRLPDDTAVDIVGTGGDGIGTFNISTAAAFVCAATGVPVAKHGNRSVSSKCGSADVLEELGVYTELAADGIETCLEDVGLAFMFAPVFHPALRHVMPVRRALGVRTCFNILGPLCNPAGVSRHFLGAFSEEVAIAMAQILDALGSTHIVVVHSDDGMDEISISDATTMYVKLPGMERIEKRRIKPEDFGIQRVGIDTVVGGDKHENAKILRAVFSGERGPARDIVTLNAAGALVAAGRSTSISDGLRMAEEAIDHERVLSLLGELCDRSQQIGRS